MKMTKCYKKHDQSGHISKIQIQKEMLKKHALHTTAADRKPLMLGHRLFNDHNKLFNSI